MDHNKRKFSLVRWLLLSPLYALYGLILLARWPFRLARSLGAARAAMKDELVCPHGHATSVVGRFHCGRCGADYLGWIGRCEVCGDESARWASCETCNVGMRLPWMKDAP